MQVVKCISFKSDIISAVLWYRLRTVGGGWQKFYSLLRGPTFRSAVASFKNGYKGMNSVYIQRVL